MLFGTTKKAAATPQNTVLQQPLKFSKNKLLNN